MADENEETTTSEQEEGAQEGQAAKDREEHRSGRGCRALQEEGGVEVPEETIKEVADEQYRELRRDAVLPGFRKGRAPRRLLEKRFGKETSEQIKVKLLAEASEAAIKDQKLDILGDPEIDYEHHRAARDRPAEVRIPGRDPAAVRSAGAGRHPGDPAQAGSDRGPDRPRDRAVAAVVGRLDAAGRRYGRAGRPDHRRGPAEPGADGRREGQAGRPGRGQDRRREPAPTYLPEAETKLDNAEIYVRPNGFVGSVPVEKLDELLVGAAVGDKKTTTVEIPKTYFREELQGRKVNIEIEIKEIKYLKPAEVNEHFLQRYEVQSVEELREKIRDNLQARIESQVRNDMSEQVYQYLLDNTKFDLPLDIVSRQAGNVLQRQYMNLLSRGLSRQQVEEQMEQLRAGSEEQAKQQLKTFFIMDKVAEKLEIEVSEEEINGDIARVAIQRGQRPEKLKEQMERDGSLAQFRLDVRQSKCISKLLETANITEAAPEEKPEKSKRSKKKKSAAEPEEGKAE